MNVTRQATWSAGIGIFLLAIAGARAQNLHFNVTAGNWDTPASWTPVQTPTSANSVFISGGRTVSISTLAQAVATYLGDSNGTVGSAEIAGAADLRSPVIQIGYYSKGSVRQSGGSVTATSYIWLGARNPGFAVYTQEAGQVTSPLMDLGYWNDTRSEYYQSGGTNSPTLLVVGRHNNSDSTYTITGGRVNAGTILVGRYGTGPGVFNMSGTANVGASVDVRLGSDQVSKNAKTYWNQSGGSLTTPTFTVGNLVGNEGSVTQSLGSVDVQVLNVGYGGTGYYMLSGSNLNATTRLALGLNSGKSYFTQTGGILTTPFVSMQDNAGTSVNVYTLSGGTLNATANFYMGNKAGACTCELVMSGGLLNCGGSFMLGYDQDGTHTVTQSGGTNNTVNLYIGRHHNTHGAYRISGGRLNVTGALNLLESWSTGSTGLLHITGKGPSINAGSYLQRATGTLELTLDPANGGMNPIEVAGTATLAGALKIGKTSGDFPPRTVVTVMTYTTRVGSLAAPTFADGVTCDVNYDVDIGGGRKAITLTSLQPVKIVGTILTVR